MKKITVLFLLFAIATFSYGQMAINSNGNNPNASAMLDISSSNKGLLIPRLALQATGDNTTIPNPATGLLVYNTNSGLLGGAGIFYNKGTAASPYWQSLMNLALPYYEATSANGAAFSIDNYGPVTTSSAVRGYGGGAGKGVEGLANSGVGVYAKSTSGNALEVSGKVKIAGNGQDPLQGKVLTTDDQGNATWQGSVAFSATGVVYNDRIIPDNTEVKVRFFSQRYDLGFDYNDANAPMHSTFIAPVDGIYHFDAQINWLNNSASGSDISILTLYGKLNGVKETLSANIKAFDGETYVHQRIGMDVKLSAGTEVWVAIFQTTGGDLSLNYNNQYCYFNGHLVVKL